MSQELANIDYSGSEDRIQKLLMISRRSSWQAPTFNTEDAEIGKLPFLGIDAVITSPLICGTNYFEILKSSLVSRHLKIRRTYQILENCSYGGYK